MKVGGKCSFTDLNRRAVMRDIRVDEYTTASSQIEMRFDQTVLSVGTCFFWSKNDHRYLVTNWHNLSGKNPLTGKHLSKTLAEPNKVKFDVWIERDLNRRGEAHIRIEDEDGPLWLEHPQHGKNVDVVCLRLPPEISPHVFPINTLLTFPIVTRIANEVFILGFPLGIGPDQLPVWKRASIATEPDINVDGLPKMLVDTASTIGMSGSPVVKRTMSSVLENGNTGIFDEPVTRFVGIYSGRVVGPNKNMDAQLGIVWKAEVIDEIIDAGRRGAR